MNLQQMMQQAQKMQAKMSEMQARMADIEVEGMSGGGMVRVSMTCKGEARSVKIDPSLASPSDVETLEDLVVAAFNNAKINADDKMAAETKRMMSELGLPSNIQLPF